MSETYIVTAKTVDEAIAVANREYADAEHEVSYEIVDMPRKGFLGIGARDAKIKITVSKIQKVELGSLVDDIRGMKKLTDRSGSTKPAQKTEKTGEKSAAQPKNTQKKTENKPSQPKKEQTQQKPAQPKAKTETNPEAKPAQKKPAQPKVNSEAQQTKKAPQQNKPVEARTEKVEKTEKPVQKKVEKTEKAENKAPQQNKPVESHTEKVEKTEKPAQKKVEARAEKAENKAEAKVENKPENKAEANETKKPRRSALGNEVKPRAPKTEPKNPKKIPATQSTVSEPLGLADFKGAKNEGFGSGDYKSGRMSNDVRKKPRVTDPAKANRDALKALTINVDEENRKAREAEKKAVETEDAKAVIEEAVVETVETVETVAVPVTETVEAVEAVETVEEAVEAVEAEETLAPVEEKKLRDGVTQEEMDYALEFANTLLANMQLDARAEAADANGEEYVINGDANVYPKINITGADTGILIGHHGETLDAIQYLVNLSALRKSKQKDGDYVKIVVDIEGYREKREETLRSLAKRMAQRAVKYKRNVFLEPMNAYERRIIHSELQFFENVSTHSVGTDKDRKIIITYEGPDKRERPERKFDGKKSRRNNSERANKEAVAEVSEGTEDGEKKRRQKPVKLPIEQLGDLLESREDKTEE